MEGSYQDNFPPRKGENLMNTFFPQKSGPPEQRNNGHLNNPQMNNMAMDMRNWSPFGPGPYQQQAPVRGNDKKAVENHLKDLLGLSGPPPQGQRQDALVVGGGLAGGRTGEGRRSDNINSNNGGNKKNRKGEGNMAPQKKSQGVSEKGQRKKNTPKQTGKSNEGRKTERKQPAKKQAKNVNKKGAKKGDNGPVVILKREVKKDDDKKDDRRNGGPKKNDNAKNNKNSKDRKGNNNRNNRNKKGDGFKKQRLGKPRLADNMSYRVSNDISQSFKEYRVPAELLEGKKDAVKEVQKVHLFGSSASGFGMKGSDLDMVLLLSGESEEEMCRTLEEALETAGYEDIKGIPQARVPVVKFKDKVTGLGSDICFNNSLALENTRLLACYAALDARLLPVALTVKRWARARRVNSTYEGTLSSYAYVLMVIHCFQNRHPPILPALQQVGKKKKVDVDGFNCYFCDTKQEYFQKKALNNHENLGRILYAFFYFFGYTFDYRNNVVCARTGTVLSKERKGWTKPVDRAAKSSYWFCIEDPFELSHNLGRCVDKGSLYNLRYEFRRAANVLAGKFPFEESGSELPKRGASIIDLLCTPYSKAEKTVNL